MGGHAPRAHCSSACYQTHSHDEFLWRDRQRPRPLSEPRPPAPYWAEHDGVDRPRRGARLQSRAGRVVVSGCCLSRPDGWVGCRRIARLPRQDFPRLPRRMATIRIAWAQFNALYASLSEPGAALAVEPADCVFGQVHGFARLDAAPPMPGRSGLASGARAHHGSAGRALVVGELAAVVGLQPLSS